MNSDSSYTEPETVRLRYSTASSCRWLCLLSICFLLLVTPAIAQQRPLVTEDPRLIPYGSVVTELGFGYFNRARFPLSGLGGNQFSAFVGGLHFGLGPRAEFQMNSVGHNFLWVHENGTGRRNDWGDVALSTKIKILDEAPKRPIISFRPTVVLPNSSQTKAIGTDGTHFFG